MLFYKGLFSLLRTLPPKECKLVVICTASDKKALQILNFLQLFTFKFEFQNLKIDELIKLFHFESNRYKKEKDDSIFDNFDISFPNGIPIKLALKFVELYDELGIEKALDLLFL